MTRWPSGGDKLAHWGRISYNRDEADAKSTLPGGVMATLLILVQSFMVRVHAR